MKKMGKRFMALAVMFATIMSFLPIQIGLNGKAANAITTDVQVTATGDNVTVSNGEYVTQQPCSDFSISVENKKVDQVTDIPIGQTGVTAQEVIIKSIDGIKLNGATLDDNNAQLGVLGCSISTGDIAFNEAGKRIGITIKGLPLGVNVIEYQIKETTVTNKGKDNVDPVTKVVTKVDDFQPAKDTYYPSSETTKQLVIQHANNFVQEKINPMTFNSYIGDINAYKENDDNNDAPFLFSQNGEYNPECPLRYKFDVSDAVTTLQYVMKFDVTVPIDNNTKVYKNGTLDENVQINGKTISGYLKELGASDLIVVKLSGDNGTTVSKSYAIQLKYNTIDADKDYSLRKPGITKLYYNADTSVKAYIGKKFDVIKENGITTYKGTINIDRKAQMISMVPELGAKSNIAFKLKNYYDNSKTENARMISGQKNPFVDFNKGTKNQLWLEVYEGQDGNIKEGTTPLVIYKLDVNFVDGGTDTSGVNFGFSDNSYLTQPGRTSIDDKINFTESRRTYNLNFKADAADTNNVTFELTSPVSYEKYNSAKRREYIKVWSGTSTQSDNLTEMSEIEKAAKVTVNVGTYKKIVVQGYYDEITYKQKDGIETKEIESKTAYPLGEKYTFYIAKNPDTTEPTVEKSTDPSLTNIKVSNGSIKSTDGASGFSTEKTNYTATVPKADKSSSVTVTAANSKVKDITATITETGDEYGLVTGEAFEFPLNATGGTSIKIVVTAEDGVTTKTYNLTINNDTRSASALLKNVITDNGDFTFDQEKNPNKIRVDQVINKLKVSPVPEESNSKITVNGTKYTGTPITIDLKGSQKTDMTITVTSEDGSASKTYDFEIYRTDSPINTGEDDKTEDIFYDEIDGCWVDLSKYEEWGTAGGKEVYFDKKGRQVKDKWITTKGVTYYLDSKGYKAKGWRKEVGGKTYYLDPNTGAVKTGWLNQNNKYYYLGLNGVMQTGWLNLNGHWYYFTPEGEMLINQSMFIDDGVYRFGADGIMY